ncbi:MAG: hypothetical protein LBH00_10555 [Planctomycetaceae bacterium]|nr:hypothetical protein [Planctomycetaceae bacterium]
MDLFRVRAPQASSMPAVRFERTPDKSVLSSEDKEQRLVTVRFLDCKFADGMRQLSDLSGKPISWDRNLDGEVISGSFVNQPLALVLGTLARRYKVSVTESSGMYFIGEQKEGDFVSAVVRVPPVERDELQASLSKFVKEPGKAVIIGSFIWLTDTLENVRRIAADIDLIREKSERSYLAEVFFIRVNEDDFLRLTADLRINQVDIFSSSFNIGQLFSMFVDASGKLGSTVIDTRPVLLLSEGRKATFEVGSEIMKERKAVSENGVISTLGYDNFHDGILLSILLRRISAEKYSLDMELEVSNFDKGDKESAIPAKYSSVLKSPGMLVKDGGVVYAGSLKRSDNSKVFGIFSLDLTRQSDLLTIWVRCREIQ